MATITAIQKAITQLSPAAFQRLCDVYLSKLGYPDMVSLGTMSGSEKTTRGTPDTYFCVFDGKYIFAEYTTQQDNLVKKIKSDLEKCTDESYTHIPVDLITEIVYCHTSSNITPGDDHELKQFCEKKGILLTIIGIDKLSYDLSVQYRALARDHLNLKIDTGQIHTAEDFIQLHDSDKLAAPLETKFIARQEELQSIESAFEKADVVVISGPAGVGKTRLSLEYAKNHQKENDGRIFCIHNRSLSLFDDLTFYFEQPDKYFILVDDANQISDLSLIIDLIRYPRDGFSFKLLITVRDYAIEKVKETLSSAVEFEEVKVEKLKDDNIKALVKESFGIINGAYLERIAIIAEGNARIAMLAGKVASRANRLDSINDASGLLEEYYGPIMRETGLSENMVLIASAGVAAFLGTLHLDFVDPVLPILASVGVDKDSFFSGLSKLFDLEIVDIYYDKAVKFSEQSFANYILKYVFCDKKALSLSKMIRTYFFVNRDRTIFAVGSLMRVFRSESVHEYVGSEIATVWKELKENEPSQFWEFMTSFYPINPTEALSLLKTAVEESPAKTIPAIDIDTEKGKNYQNISDEILTVLCGFADSEDAESAIDLFLQYYLKRPDKYIQFYHSAISGYGITSSSIDHDFRTQLLFFEKIGAYSENWKNEYILLLFLEIAHEFLKLEFTGCESGRNGKTAIMYRFSLVPSEGVSSYRSIIWNYLQQIAESGEQSERIKTVIESYGKSVSAESSDIVREDAAFICDIVKKCFAPNNLHDCLIVEKTASLFEMYGISIDELRLYLNNPTMDAYQLLKGPSLEPDFDFDRQRKEHETTIASFYRSADSKVNTFYNLYDAYSSTSDPEYCVSNGLNIALQLLSDNPQEYVEAIKYILRKGYNNGVNLITATQTLFKILTAEELYKLIEENACNALSANEWFYSYYHEIPPEAINEDQMNGLYRYLRDKSDSAIQKSPFRDIWFLKKYLPADPNVFPTASRIILDKQAYSSFMPIIYFFTLLNPREKDQPDVINAYYGHIDVLEDIYFFLLHHGRNPDLEGSILLEISKADCLFPRRLALELLHSRKTISLHNEIGTRCTSLYNLDNHIEVLDAVVNNAFELAEFALYVPSVIDVFLLIPNNRKDLAVKRNDWIRHFIHRSANDIEKMEAVFEAVSKHTESLRKMCIECVIKENPSIELFRRIDLLPRSYSATGSFVPVYKGWIEFLKSLLPLFHGIQYIDHKDYVQKKIERIQDMIVKEEISNIVRG